MNDDPDGHGHHAEYADREDWDLGPAADALRRLLPGVTDERLGGPTPCPEWNVAALLDHLIGLSWAFTAAAQKIRVGGEPSGDAGRLPPDWRERLPDQLGLLVAAWRQDGAREGATEAGGVELPADLMGIVALNELVLHGWDLARATGQELEVTPAAVRACHRLFVAAGGGGDDPEGPFGPSVPVPDEATAFDKLLGSAGRDPGWHP
ncbi:TIGR03086 family metal-binding protein [Rhodococcus triatomae]|uniref:TIGR03086 family metal-binding protein n=1 Tax=Rhodococcus triatomae TaxID=300028 RepID=UPI0009345A1D|nr:TIGR03086 family metal-binding protein [Rhodococcus triatomae]